MSVYTKLGVKFWEWSDINALPAGPRLLWIGLYTSGQGRQSVPGLFYGSITAMADAVHLPVDEVLRYLDTLLEHDLVEYDRERRVLRFTKLPDAGEAPTNGNTIRGWWRKFQIVPQCLVRDAHIVTLRWIMDEWSRENGKPLSADHSKAWAETFGNASLVTIPPPRKRGVRRLLDNDTGTNVQPSLFGSNPFLAQGTLPGTTAEPETYSSSPASGSLNDLATPETLSKPFRKERDQDQDRVKDPDQVSGSGSSPDPEVVTPRANPVCGTVSPPPLRLVPLPVDERDRRRAEIIRAIGPKHAMAFQRVKKAIGSTAFGPSVVDDFAELRQLLHEIPLDDAMERCEHALVVREAEALNSRPPSMQYFGSGMWRRRNFENALTREVADVDGSRSAPAARGVDAFEVSAQVFRELAAKEPT